MATDITSKLQQLAEKGQAEGVITPQQVIVVGSRMKNSFLREIVRKFKETSNVSDSDLIKLILAYDQVVEEGLLTDEILDAIEKDPNLLKK